MDKLGNKLTLGCTVAFGKRVGNHGELGIGEVVELEVKVYPGSKELGCRLKMASGRETVRVYSEVARLGPSDSDKLNLLLLQSLEDYGVDNWEGYSDALHEGGYFKARDGD